jgi:uncharacterized protein YjiS (DUF1127 family)
MAYTNTISPAAEAAAPHSLFARVRRLLSDYDRYRRTLADLNGLSSRELDDIGLTREQIRDVARDSVYGAN